MELADTPMNRQALAAARAALALRAVEDAVQAEGGLASIFEVVGTLLVTVQDATDPSGAIQAAALALWPSVLPPWSRWLLAETLTALHRERR